MIFGLWSLEGSSITEPFVLIRSFYILRILRTLKLLADLREWVLVGIVKHEPDPNFWMTNKMSHNQRAVPLGMGIREWGSIQLEFDLWTLTCFSNIDRLVFRPYLYFKSRNLALLPEQWGLVIVGMVKHEWALSRFTDNQHFRIIKYSALAMIDAWGHEKLVNCSLIFDLWSLPTNSSSQCRSTCSCCASRCSTSSRPRSSPSLTSWVSYFFDSFNDNVRGGCVVYWVKRECICCFFALKFGNLLYQV